MTGHENMKQCPQCLEWLAAVSIVGSISGTSEVLDESGPYTTHTMGASPYGDLSPEDHRRSRKWLLLARPTVKNPNIWLGCWVEVDTVLLTDRVDLLREEIGMEPEEILLVPHNTKCRRRTVPMPIRPDLKAQIRAGIEEGKARWKTS